MANEKKSDYAEIASLLMQSGDVGEKQLKHAERIRAKAERERLKIMRKTRMSLAWSIALLMFLIPAAHAEQVVLPLTLDHQLLTSLVIKDTFTGKNHSASIVGSPGDCTYIGISEPKFTTAGSFLQLEMRLSLRLGTELGTECLVPLEWQGYITLVQQPVFDNQTFSLAFRTVDSKLYNLNPAAAVPSPGCSGTSPSPACWNTSAGCGSISRRRSARCATFSRRSFTKRPARRPRPCWTACGAGTSRSRRMG